MEMTIDETIRTLEDMKVNIPVPKAAVMQNKKNAALDYAISSLKTDKAYNLIYEGVEVEVYTKEEVATMLRNLLSEISEILPNVAANDYWDGYMSCKNDVIKRMILSKIDKLLKEDK